MKFGVQTFSSPTSIMPDVFARAAEERGFESVYFPDHTHIPYDTVQAGAPERYQNVIDVLVALTAAAVATQTIGIGTSICIVPQRDPIVLAKQIASIDQLSGGRVIFGVGAGSIDQELLDHGTDPKNRFRVMRERIEAMHRIWTSHVASYFGDTVTFPPMVSDPKPAQVGGPPILVGGWGPRACERVFQYGDGWLPFRAAENQVDDGSGEHEPFEEDLAAGITRLAERARELERPMPSVTLFNADPHPAALERYAAMGVDRCIFWLASTPAPTVLSRLDRLAELSRDHANA